MAKEKMTRIFQMSVDTMEKFFNAVEELKAQGFEDTKELRMAVLNELANMGQMDLVYDTKRTKEQVTEDFRKRGFKIDDRTKRG